MNNMFNDAKPFLFECANELRRSMTTAEIMLWKYLRTKPRGHKFRRQHPFGLYVLDFYCHPLKLAIEVDGPIHDLEMIKENDYERQKNIEGVGVSMARFSNEEILTTMAEVVSEIEILITKINKRQNLPPL
jgi:very-short-patch-repair endonuclease